MCRCGHWSLRAHKVLMSKAGSATSRRMLGLALFVVHGGLLVSCGGDPRLGAPADLSPAPTVEISAVPLATPRTTVKPEIGQVVWTAAIDAATIAPTEPVSIYPLESPRIIAATKTQSLPAGSRLEARWEYNDTSLDAFTTQLIPAEMIDQRWVTFHIERDPDVPWPGGVYEVTISLDGTAMQQASVEVSD